MAKKLTEGWELYMIRTRSGKLYTGIAKSAAVRFEEHCTDPKKGAKFFRGEVPDAIVYLEKHPDRSSASKREYAIKQMSKAEKLKLISEGQG